jgi:glycosyltransferase involved in cell wall biosynthesis
MHIGFLSGEYPPYPLGGVGARVTDLARGLVRAGHSVSVVGIYPHNRNVKQLVDEMLEGVRVIRIPQSPMWMRWRPGLLWDRYRIHVQFRRLHRQAPFDLIEVSDGCGFALLGVPAGVPMAMRMDGTTKVFDEAMGIPGDRFYYWMEETALRKARFLSAPSAYARDSTLRLFGLQDRECAVIYNAVDTDAFSPGSQPTEPGLIVCTNSVEPRKGVREMIIAMNEICASHPQARLVFIGSDTQPKVGGRTYGERVLDEARPEVRERISFTGQLDRYTAVLDYLRRAHICSYPCQVETFGIAPLEAMAVGKPVIYGKSGPGPELIEDGVSGLLCDAQSPASIAACVKRILSEPGLAQTLGRNARQRALNMFAREPWIRRNIDYYSGCIKSWREQHR